MHAFFDLLNEMSPYLLFGFFIAGLLHAFVPSRLYSQYLSAPTWRSVFLAAIFGVPLPLCSCGVIPTAMSLHREGASRGATTAFLIATPQTGVDSIVATFAMMGLPFAILRPLVAFVTAVFGGCLVNAFDDEEHVSPPVAAGGDCGDGCKTERQGAERMNFCRRLLDALHYGFVEMPADLGKWLVMGLVLAALITIFLPVSFMAQFADNPLLSILFVLLLSIPMYLCATGSIPVAAALMLKGLSPGAALVLLMAGPASNVASILVVRRVLGTRTLLLYLLSLVVGGVAFALGVDYGLPREWFLPKQMMDEACCHEPAALFPQLCSAVLLLLLAYALLLRPVILGRKARQEVVAISDAAPSAGTTADLGFPKHVLSVEGMSCHHCSASVERALLAVEGVVSATVSLETKCAIVEGDADVDALLSAIAAVGYEARLASSSS